MKRTVLTIIGWFLTLLGLAALVLPGPGLLLLLAGLVVLSQEYDWAERRVEPVKRQAFKAAKIGVATWPRILISAAGAIGLIALGFVWWHDPDIPDLGVIGPTLPLGGWATGSSLILSGFIAFGLLVYSVVRWHGEARAERRQ